jgi:hypothetical protein
LSSPRVCIVEEAAARGTRLVQFRLKFRYLALRSLQGKVQAHGTLNQKVIGIRLLRDGVADEGIGGGVFRVRFRLAELLKKACE